MKKIIIVLVLFLIIGCESNNSSQPETETYEIVRVYFHKCRDYSVMVKEGDQLKIIDLPTMNNNFCQHPKGNNLFLIADVPANEPMRLIRVGKNYFIHVHSEKDISK